MDVGLKFPKGKTRKKEFPTPQVSWGAEKAIVTCADDTPIPKNIISSADLTGHYLNNMA